MATFFASIAIPRDLAFQIFFGVGERISGPLATAFIDGMRSALFVSILLLMVAFVLSILRGKERRAMDREKKERDHP